MKGTYNNQNRKSGGYPKAKITVGKKVGGQSLPCDEKRHSDCEGYLTFFPHLKGYACQCDCHKKTNMTTKVKPTVEKWEELEKLWRFAKKPPTAGGQPGEMKPVKQIFFEMVIDLIAHSVQEAKAGRDEYWIKRIASLETVKELTDKSTLNIKEKV